ncbi:hypothetical protein NKH18_44130 [Streptomyces sp. M10(2022)]
MGLLAESRASRAQGIRLRAALRDRRGPHRPTARAARHGSASSWQCCAPWAVCRTGTVPRC